MTKKQKIIAIIGMAGSGKTEVVKKVQEKYSVPKVYFGEITFDELRRRNMEVNYKNERVIREDLRAKHGMGVYAKLSILKIKEFLKNNNVVLAESLYSWDEFKIMKEEFGKDFLTVAVYASPNTRFKRLTKRFDERPIADWEEFKTRDWTEIGALQKGGPIAMSDYTIVNEGSREEFLEKIEKLFKSLISVQ